MTSLLIVNSGAAANQQPAISLAAALGFGRGEKSAVDSAGASFRSNASAESAGLAGQSAGSIRPHRP
jgi:hypothetical protein